MSVTLERKLPEEVLDHIVSFSTRDTLTKLCLASKQLGRLATAHLYSDIFLGAVNFSDGSTYIKDFAHLLFSSPAHARLVTSVLVMPAWGSAPEYTKQERPVYPWPNIGSPELESLLRSQLEKFSLDQADTELVYDKIKTGTNEDAIVALLLLSLPNLRRLDFNAGFSDEHPDFVSIFELLADNIKSCDESSAQVDVMVKGEDDKYPNLPLHLAVLMHMPNLRSIYGWKLGDHEGEPDPDFARLKPGSCPVEYIELRSSKLHKDNFRDLMNATIPGRLKTLIYEIGCTWAWCQISHPNIMTGLQAHHQTLENLCLSHEYFYPHESDDDSEEPYPCDFKPFTALKRLKVAPVYVWGHEGFTSQAKLADQATKEMLWKALPANLQQLWVCRAESQGLPARDDDDAGALRFEPDCLLPALDLVVQNKQNFPELEEILIELPPGRWPENETFDNLEMFCRAAKGCGIRTRIILTDVVGVHAERKWGWDEEIEWGECLGNNEAEKKCIDVDCVDELAKLIRELRDEADAKMPTKP